MAIRIARAIVPAFARAWLRSILRPYATRGARPASAAGTQPTAAPVPTPAERRADQGSAGMSLEAFLRFSVADLHYTETDLDRAMDLLAICRVGLPPIAG